jgi:hypothetical protein
MLELLNNRINAAKDGLVLKPLGMSPLSELTPEKWQFSLGSKLMGQINLVQEAIPFIKEKGSFTLISGVLNDEPIFAGVAASAVSGALEGASGAQSFFQARHFATHGRGGHCQ